jgi:DNA-directed RNA polymerase specialized sigma24 family protein
MTDAGVPVDAQDLFERYDRDITQAIKRSSGRRLDEDDVAEFRQQVYLRIMEYRALERSRVYYATHPGHFLGYLRTIVRHVVWKRAERGRADPLYETHSTALPEGEVEAAWAAVRDHGPALEAADLLERASRNLESPRRRTPVRAVLDAARVHGLHSQRLAEVTGGNASAIRHSLVAIRAEIRKLGGPCH